MSAMWLSPNLCPSTLHTGFPENLQEGPWGAGRTPKHSSVWPIRRIKRNLRGEYKWRMTRTQQTGQSRSAGAGCQSSPGTTPRHPTLTIHEKCARETPEPLTSGSQPLLTAGNNQASRQQHLDLKPVKVLWPVKGSRLRGILRG